VGVRFFLLHAPRKCPFGLLDRLRKKSCRRFKTSPGVLGYQIPAGKLLIGLPVRPFRRKRDVNVPVKSAPIVCCLRLRGHVIQVQERLRK